MLRPRQDHAMAAIAALRSAGRRAGDEEAAAALRVCDTYHEAAALARRLRQDGIEIGTASFSVILSVCALRGQPHYAEEVLEEMARRGVPQEGDGAAQLLLLRAYCGARDAAGAAARLRALVEGRAPSLPKDLGPAHQIVMSACETQCHSRGDRAQALDLMEETLLSAESLGCLTPQLWAGALSVCEAGRDPTRGVDVLTRMDAEGVYLTELGKAAVKRLENQMRELQRAEEEGAESAGRSELAPQEESEPDELGLEEESSEEEEATEGGGGRSLPTESRPTTAAAATDAAVTDGEEGADEGAEDPEENVEKEEDGAVEQGTEEAT
eukprot:Hpha_TRINITY_DN27259_c0_g1::TRINITY_DN27259_c0_g1_i1::g.140786::m.140786